MHATLISMTGLPPMASNGAVGDITSARWWLRLESVGKTLDQVRESRERYLRMLADERPSGWARGLQCLLESLDLSWLRDENEAQAYCKESLLDSIETRRKSEIETLSRLH
jgi:hypothetical protein